MNEPVPLPPSGGRGTKPSTYSHTMPHTARERFLQEEAENIPAAWQERDVSDLASVLEDFLDEEVVDRQGTAIGTLACYWQSVCGSLVFFGVRLEGQESIRAVIGRRSQVDDRRVCIRLGFDVEVIEDAPIFDPAQELDAIMERRVHEYFSLAGLHTEGTTGGWSADRAMAA